MSRDALVLQAAKGAQGPGQRRLLLPSPGGFSPTVPCHRGAPSPFVPRCLKLSTSFPQLDAVSKPKGRASTARVVGPAAYHRGPCRLTP
jgi:hypothetical protein